MRAPTPVAPTRRVAAPALLALAVVAALSTGAGSDTPALADRAAAADRATGAGAGTAARLRAGGGAARAGERPANRSEPAAPPPPTYRPDPRDPAHPGIPPPHAPGHDDVKTWDDPPPRRARPPSTPAGSDTGPLAGGPDAGLGRPGAMPPVAAPAAVPWPVLPTSWQNRQLAASLPRPDELAGSAAAAADFLRAGRLVWWAVQPATADRPARLRLLDRDAAGHWIDVAARLVTADDARVCAQPRQVLVADFNRDDRPDAYVVCDGEPHLAWLSGADGRYRRVDTGYAGWSGAAEAADVDADGQVDVIATEDPRAPLLHGRGDGRFDPRPR